jgi:hypothetical protein
MKVFIAVSLGSWAVIADAFWRITTRLSAAQSDRRIPGHVSGSGVSPLRLQLLHSI